MSTAENKDVVRRFIAAIEARDSDTVRALQSPDIRWWMNNGAEFDLESFMNIVTHSILAAESISLKITSMTAEDDRVAFEADGEYAFPDRIYRNKYHNLYRVRGGLIVEAKEYMDTTALAALTGA